MNYKFYANDALNDSIDDTLGVMETTVHNYLNDYKRGYRNFTELLNATTVYVNLSKSLNHKILPKVVVNVIGEMLTAVSNNVVRFDENEMSKESQLYVLCQLVQDRTNTARILEERFAGPKIANEYAKQAADFRNRFMPVVD